MVVTSLGLIDLNLVHHPGMRTALINPAKYAGPFVFLHILKLDQWMMNGFSEESLQTTSLNDRSSADAYVCDVRLLH